MFHNAGEDIGEREVLFFVRGRPEIAQCKKADENWEFVSRGPAQVPRPS